MSQFERNFNDIFVTGIRNGQRAENYLEKRDLKHRLKIMFEGKEKVIQGHSYHNCILQANELGEWVMVNSWREE